MNKKIYIRADGNEIIATGHIMRCLSVAKQLKKLNIEVIFVVADDRPSALIESNGFKVDVLGTVWDNLDKETEIICDYINHNNVEVLLIDTYYVTEDYLQNLSIYTKIVYIDDLRKFTYRVDTIVNYSLFGNKDIYYKLYGSENNCPKLLQGGDYVPLREEFSYAPFNLNQQPKKVLITTGGTDSLNVAGNVLDTVLNNEELQNLEYHVVVGCFNQNKENLNKISTIYSNVFLHENVKNMSEFMRDCDIAISAGGTTLYELCACGIPTICLEIADNQKGAIAWEQNEIMLYAGNAAVDMKQCMATCLDKLIQYNRDYELRRRNSRKMQSLIDGNGARRIAEYVDTLF